MKKLFLFVYIINGLMAPVTYGDKIDFTKKKPIICAFNGNKVDSDNADVPAMEPNAIPPECDIICFTDCDFNNLNNFSCPDYFKAVVDLKRPLIVEVYRSYDAWCGIFKPDGNADDVKAIVDFAKANGAIGVFLGGISKYEGNLKPDVNVANNAVQYFKQLKSDPNFIVGIYLNAEKSILTDTHVFNYEASNEFVDFYMVNTYRMNNKCDVTKFNGLTPTIATNGLIGIDTVIGWAKSTKMCMDKVYFVVDLVVDNPKLGDGGCGCFSYGSVCTVKTDISKWCIPTTKDLYEKAKYIMEKKYGIFIYWIEFDDPENACGCSKFIGLKNIVAGYKCGKQTPCAKINTKLTAGP